MRLLLVTNRTMGRIVLEDVEPSKSGSLKGFLLKGSLYIYIYMCFYLFKGYYSCYYKDFM